MPMYHRGNVTRVAKPSRLDEPPCSFYIKRSFPLYIAVSYKNYPELGLDYFLSLQALLHNE